MPVSPNKPQVPPASSPDGKDGMSGMASAATGGNDTEHHAGQTTTRVQNLVNYPSSDMSSDEEDGGVTDESVD